MTILTRSVFGLTLAALLAAPTRLKESREHELAALVAPETRAAVERNGIELVSYVGLG